MLHNEKMNMGPKVKSNLLPFQLELPLPFRLFLLSVKFPKLVSLIL